MTRERELEIIELIKREVKPALGCTEPVAVSLAVAKAAEALREIGVEPDRVEIAVSGNILKNGMGVGVPGTGMVGLHIAAALGVTCGVSGYRLEVLKDLNKSSIDKAKKMLEDKLVSLSIAETDKKLYISAECTSGKHSSSAIIEDNHDNITQVIRDNKIIYKSGSQGSESKNSNNENREISDEGLENNYGLKVGKTIKDNIHKNVFGDGLLTHSKAITAAASDARMAGCNLPAMSNSGSGNQGITVTMPVIAASDKLGSSQLELARALVLAHLIAIHIKGYLGKLSALCGCVIASTGASCGIVYLKGGNYDQICYSIKNMIGNITGMVCDGAKVGCALKVASGVSSAVQSAILALDNICISDNDGIIEKDIEKTIHNLGKIGSKGMQITDDMILDIMVCK